MRQGELHISGLNGLLLGIAKERDIEGICLLGEVPSYASRIQNPMAALAITEVLSRMLHIKVDTTELAQIASETKDRIKQLAAEATEEYINLFTEPIWEKEDDEEDEEE